ncbi:YY1-associated factor 2 isoform X1 [Triplophysa dalaica]|uniref:YY1-associated factor 2 isoform X1 n=1 Tax=Triplophysa dalaica TaxID=1582913 RepID=UPI0024DF41A2|nr:YY1-associated factor 2 isoform X1 [Triplophysa dalaica]
MGDKRSPTRPKRQAKPSSDDGFWDCSVCTFKNSAEAFKCMMCDVRKGTSTRHCSGASMKAEGTWKLKPEGGNAELQCWILGDAKGKQMLGENGRKQCGREIWNGGRQRTICQTGGLAVKRCEEKKPRPVSQLAAQQVPQQFASPTQPKKEKKERTEKDKCEKESTMKKNSHKKMRPRLKNVDRSSAQHLEVTVGDLTVIITDFKEKTKPSSSSSSNATCGDHHSQSGSNSDNTEKGISRSSSPRGEGSSINGESH